MKRKREEKKEKWKEKRHMEMKKDKLVRVLLRSAAAEGTKLFPNCACFQARDLHLHPDGSSVKNEERRCLGSSVMVRTLHVIALLLRSTRGRQCRRSNAYCQATVFVCDTRYAWPVFVSVKGHFCFYTILTDPLRTMKKTEEGENRQT